MLTTRLNIRRAARILRRGGFTLVELLVVIGIIAILAGVALGPITNGIKKAKQSSGTQSAHAIGLAMYSYANDNSQNYPDKSGGTADDVAAALLGGGYVTDATIFYISSDSAATKITTANNVATNIAGSGVTCWDFLAGGSNSTVNTWLPLVWSTVAGSGTAPNVNAITPTAIVGTPLSTNPFSTDGLAIFYINNSAAFVTSSVSGATLQVTMLKGASNLTATAPSYTILSGK